MVESMGKNGALSAKAILDIMEGNLTNNDDLVGVGAIFEQGSITFEPSEAATLVDSKQRFSPYLSKNNSDITAALIEGADDKSVADWYWIPKEEKRAVLTEPYNYNVNGQTVLMTTISVPLVNASGTFLAY